LPISNIHLLRGDDAYSIELRIKQIVQSLGADFDAAMNTSRLDGKTATLDDINLAVGTLPFFGINRLVILESALSKVDKAKQEKFLKIIETAPPSTHLVMIIEDHLKWRRDANGKWQQNWELLTPAHWLMKWMSGRPNAEIIDVPLPDDKSMEAWVVAEAKRQGGDFEPEAVRELIRHIGNDTGIASQEIGKLLMYVNFERSVNQTDVIEGVSVEGSADVFVMLDALMDGNAQQAQSLMHRLLGDTPPEVIFGSVVHRIRQLIQVREALDAREDLKSLVDKRVLFGNQVSKYTTAAWRFPLARLKKIYRRLLEIDVQSKTSQTDLETDLELLVVELGN
jgi:DNA polymerase III subunit delta